jgi:hypothetical protein
VSVQLGEVSEVMPEYTIHEKTTGAKRNSGRIV